MHDFCTCFDINYAARGLAMCESLIGVSRGEPVRVFVLCLDEEVFELLNRCQWPGLVPVPLAGIEQHDPLLLAAKNNRSKVEYYFTLSSCLVHFLLNTREDVTMLTYLDADLFFFSSWAVLFQEMGDSSIMVIPHRFPARLRHLEKGGAVICAGIHMSEIPAFPYDILWGERSIRSVANLTRDDGVEFLELAAQVPLHAEIHRFPLAAANEALQQLRRGAFQGAAVLTMNG